MEQVKLKQVFLYSPDWTLSKKIYPQGSIKHLDQQQSCHLFLQACRTNECGISKINFDNEQFTQDNMCEKFVSMTKSLSKKSKIPKFDRHKVQTEVLKCIDLVLAILWQVIFDINKIFIVYLLLYFQVIIKDHSNQLRIVCGIHRVSLTKLNSCVVWPEFGSLDSLKNIVKPIGRLKIFGPDRNIHPYDGTPLPSDIIGSLESPMNQLLNIAFSHPSVVTHSFIDKK